MEIHSSKLPTFCKTSFTVRNYQKYVVLHPTIRTFYLSILGCLRTFIKKRENKRTYVIHQNVYQIIQIHFKLDKILAYG